MATKPKPMLSHCNECGHETKHAIVAEPRKIRSFTHDRVVVDVGSDWKLLQCLGCDEVSLRRIDWCSEDFPEDGPYTPTFFPPRVSRRRPEWMARAEVPGAYAGLLDEVYTALHADSGRLAMMGARALIDAAIKRAVGHKPNFPQGLDALEKKNVLSGHDRRILETAIHAGHASAHQGHKATPESLNTVMDIVERLIQSELLLDGAKRLKKATPKKPRTKAKRKAPASSAKTASQTSAALAKTSSPKGTASKPRVKLAGSP